jgi:predicted PhzF superfamily epimerase YddE/YHI9
MGGDHSINKAPSRRGRSLRSCHAGCGQRAAQSTSARSGAFFTRSGALDVTLHDGKYTLDFPLVVPSPIAAPQGLFKALGLAEDAGETWQASDIIVVIDDEALLDALKPDFNALNAFNTRGVVVTAASRTFDFRSRWFGPQVGVNEDPVTGSAHTFLAPLWSEKLAKKRFMPSKVVTVRENSSATSKITDVLNSQAKPVWLLKVPLFCKPTNL